MVTGARIFTGLDVAPRAAGRPARGQRPRAAGDSTQPAPPPPAPTGPRNCHDVTAYPAAKLLAGACGSYGLLVDVSNPEKPVRLDAKADTNFSLWHTAVFSNDGKKVVFTDEGRRHVADGPGQLDEGWVATPSLDRFEEEVQAARLLQDPVGPDGGGELRVAQTAG